MKEAIVAVGISIALTLTLFAALKQLAPADAGQLATGAMALSYVIFEHLRRTRIKSDGQTSRLRPGWSPLTGFLIGSSLVIGLVNLTTAITSSFVVLIFGKMIPVPTLTFVMAFSHFWPALIIFFLLGRLVSEIRSHRIFIAMLIPLPNAALEALLGFFVFASFDARYLGVTVDEDRLFLYGLKFAMQFAMVAAPFWAGAAFYALRRASVLRTSVSSMMRLLPLKSQEAIRDLVRQEYEQAQVRP